MRPLAAGILAACGVLAFAVRADAASQTRLFYARGPGAESCPDEGALRRIVAARLGYDPFFIWAKPAVTAAIGADTRGLHAEVDLVDEGGHTRGTRTMDAARDDCDDLVGAVALAISIAIDPLVLTHPAPLPDVAPAVPPPSAAAPAPTEAPKPAPPTPATAAPPRPTPTREVSPPRAPDDRRSEPDSVHAATHARGLHPSLGLGSALTTGTAPAPAWGLAGFAEIAVGPWSAALELQAYFPATGGLAAGGTIHTSLDTVTLAPCARPFGPIVVCGLASAGIFRASAQGLAHEASPNVFYAAFGGRLGLDVPLGGRFYALVHGDLEANATRHTVLVDGQSAFHVGPAAAGGGLELAVRF